MAGEREGRRAAAGIGAALVKYKYVLLVLLAGVVCMAWPSGKDRSEPAEGSAGTPAPAVSERQEISQLQKEMEEILGRIEGVGELRLMLTLDRGTSKALAQDAALSYSGLPTDPEDYSRSTDTVVLSKSGSGESVVVVHETYPQFRGALVVCQGGGDPAVRLSVIEAVSALTGLGSDRISVVKFGS